MTDGKVKVMKIENIFANKKIALVIVVLLVLLLIAFLLRLIFSSPKSSIPPVIDVPKASFSPSPRIVGQPFPSVISSTPSAQIKSLVYKPGELTKDYERISSHPPLSSADQTVKTNLLRPLNSQSGVVASTNQFRIEYVKSPDLFMIEVRSINPNIGKNAAEQYLKDQGLSTSGVCNLPVLFYLSQQVQDDLISKGQTFNPIPTGC